MQINEFFDFSSKFLPTTVQTSGVDLAPTKSSEEKGDALNLLSGEYDGIVFPVRFQQKSGYVFHDIIGTRRTVLFLISDRMRDVLTNNDLTGWTAFPILLTDIQGRRIEGYQGLSITGRCGPVDYSKSEVINKRLVPTGPLCKFFKGIPIGLDEWDGSDFFLPEGNYRTVVTEHAADIIKFHRLTNIELRNLAEIEVLEQAAQPSRS